MVSLHFEVELLQSEREMKICSACKEKQDSSWIITDMFLITHLPQQNGMWYLISKLWQSALVPCRLFNPRRQKKYSWLKMSARPRRWLSILYSSAGSKARELFHIGKQSGETKTILGERWTRFPAAFQPHKQEEAGYLLMKASVSVRFSMHSIENNTYTHQPCSDADYNYWTIMHWIIGLYSYFKWQKYSKHVILNTQEDWAFLALAPLLSNTTTGAWVAPLLPLWGQAAIVPSALSPRGLNSWVTGGERWQRLPKLTPPYPTLQTRSLDCVC